MKGKEPQWLRLFPFVENFLKNARFFVDKKARLRRMEKSLFIII